MGSGITIWSVSGAGISSVSGRNDVEKFSFNITRTELERALTYATVYGEGVFQTIMVEVTPNEVKPEIHVSVDDYDPLDITEVEAS